MHRLNYSGGTLLLADAVCHALMDYARALAAEGSADTIVIPITTETGDQVDAEILIGPSSQLYSTPAGEDFPAPGDDGVVEELRTRTARILVTGSSAEGEPPWRGPEPVSGDL